MTHKEYNGWTNYETWNVKLWIDNEQGSSEYWAEAATEAWDEAEYKRTYQSQTRKESASCILADHLKNEFEEAQPEVTGMWADLLNAAMSEVNWYEIAENMLEEFEEPELSADQTSQSAYPESRDDGSNGHRGMIDNQG
jgi:hypothetical protein